MFYCLNCGSPLRGDARFCHVCGAEQIMDEHPAPEPRRPVPPAPAPEPERPVPPAPAPEPEKPEAPAPAKAPEPAQVQIPLPMGSYTWENVKINGEFKNGVGTITITFS